MDDLRIGSRVPVTRRRGATKPLVPLQDRARVAARPADHFSIQLVGVNDQQSPTNYINQNAHVLKDQTDFLQQGTHVSALVQPGFMAIMQSEDAQQALQDLPCGCGNSPGFGTHRHDSMIFRTRRKRSPTAVRRDLGIFEHSPKVKF